MHIVYIRVCVGVGVCEGKSEKKIKPIKQTKQVVINGIIQSANRDRFTVSLVNLGCMLSAEPATGFV